MTRHFSAKAVAAPDPHASRPTPAHTPDVHGAVPSTNTLVTADLDAGRAVPFAHRARSQSAGTGRTGRSWSSPEGGLYLSAALPIDPARVPQAGSVSPAIATALAEFLSGLAEDPAATGGQTATVSAQPGRTQPGRPLIEVKWPNDLFCAGGKLAGISCDLVSVSVPDADAAPAKALCVGVGLNVFVPAEGRPRIDGPYGPTYLADVAPCLRTPLSADPDFRDGFLADLGESVFALLVEVAERWNAQGFSAFRPEMEKRLLFAGEEVVLVGRDGHAIATGAVAGVDADAALLVDVAGEGTERFFAGEVHLRSSQWV